MKAHMLKSQNHSAEPDHPAVPFDIQKPRIIASLHLETGSKSKKEDTETGILLTLVRPV